MKKSINMARLALIAAATISSQSVQAIVEWNYSSSANSGLSSGSVVNSSYNFTASGTSVTSSVTGWANTSTSDPNSVLQQETVKTWSGLGVQRTGESSSPQHATDNNGTDEMILFNFSDAITLKEVSISWYNTDADITVLAYTGAGAPDLNQNSYGASDLPGGGTVGLTNDGWTLIGNYHNLQNTGYSADLSANNVSSSYYLVGALNYAVNGVSNSSNYYNDYFKISALSGDVTPPDPSGQAPAPASIILMLIGFLSWRASNASQNNKPLNALATVA